MKDNLIKLSSGYSNLTASVTFRRVSTYRDIIREPRCALEAVNQLQGDEQDKCNCVANPRVADFYKIYSVILISFLN